MFGRKWRRPSTWTPWIYGWHSHWHRTYRYPVHRGQADKYGQ